jgi:hypothetical protein
MNDDVKAARESIKEFRDWAQRLNQLARHSKDGMSNSLIAADNQRAIEVKTKVLLAHIDGEPARIAAACEETREAVARHVMGPALKRDPDLFADHLEEVYAATIRRMPLTATPLADALARAEEGVRYWTDLAQAEARDAAALRARVAELERDSAAMTVTANAEVAAGLAIAAERDALRAQVEAARKVCELRIKTQWRVPDVYITAHDVLRAMDGEKP